MGSSGGGWEGAVIWGAAMMGYEGDLMLMEISNEGLWKRSICYKSGLVRRERRLKLYPGFHPIVSVEPRGGETFSSSTFSPIAPYQWKSGYLVCSEMNSTLSIFSSMKTCATLIPCIDCRHPSRKVLGQNAFPLTARSPRGSPWACSRVWPKPKGE